VYFVESVYDLLAAVAAEDAVAEAVEVGEEEAAAEGHALVDAFDFHPPQIDLRFGYSPQVFPLFPPQKQFKLKRVSFKDDLLFLFL
jgi:hypothetical protein